MQYLFCMDPVVKRLEMNRKLPILMGHEDLGAPSETLLKFKNEGLSSNFFEPDLSIAVVAKNESKQLQRITMASLLPLNISVIAEEQLLNWLLLSKKEQKKFALVIYQGAFVKDIYEFVIEVLRACTVLSKEKKLAMQAAMDRDPLSVERFAFIMNLQEFQGALPDVQSLQCHMPESLQKCFLYSSSTSDSSSTFLKIQSEIDHFIEKEKKVYVFNTEELPIRDFEFEADLLMVPCAGFKPISIIQQQLKHKKIQEVIFLEKSEAAIAHYSELLQLNECSDLESFLLKAMEAQDQLPAENLSYVRKMFQSVLDQGFESSYEKFVRAFEIAKINPSFHKVNYLDEHEAILKLIPTNKKILFWHSNVWRTNTALYKYGQPELRKNYSELLIKIGQKFQLPVWLHKDSYEAIIGESISSPQMVLTAGFTKGSVQKAKNAYMRVFSGT